MVISPVIYPSPSMVISPSPYSMTRRQWRSHRMALFMSANVVDGEYGRSPEASSAARTGLNQSAHHETNCPKSET